MASLVIDTSPLRSAPTPAQLRAYRRGLGEVTGPPVRVRPCLGGISYTTGMVAAGLSTALLASAGADPRLVALGCAATAAAALGAALCARATSVRTCLREYRLAALAHRNGLVYERGAVEPILPGLAYSDGAGRPLRRFTGELAGTPLEAGNFRHATGALSGYVIVGARVAIVPPIDFAEPAEWQRVSRLVTSNG